MVSDEEFHLLCLTHYLRDDIFDANHTDLGHQGRDRIIFMEKRQIFSPGLELFTKQHIQTCCRCISRNTVTVPVRNCAELLNITSSKPMA